MNDHKMVYLTEEAKKIAQDVTSKFDKLKSKLLNNGFDEENAEITAAKLCIIVSNKFIATIG